MPVSYMMLKIWPNPGTDTAVLQQGSVSFKLCSPCQWGYSKAQWVECLSDFYEYPTSRVLIKHHCKSCLPAALLVPQQPSLWEAVSGAGGLGWPRTPLPALRPKRLQRGAHSLPGKTAVLRWQQFQPAAQKAMPMRPPEELLTKTNCKPG